MGLVRYMKGGAGHKGWDRIYEGVGYVKGGAGYVKCGALLLFYLH